MFKILSPFCIEQKAFIAGVVVAETEIPEGNRDGLIRRGCIQFTDEPVTASAVANPEPPSANPVPAPTIESTDSKKKK